MESPSSDSKSYQVCGGYNEEAGESDMIEASYKDCQERVCTGSSTMTESEKRWNRCQGSPEFALNSLEEQDKLDSLLDKRDEIKRLIIQREQEIAQTRKRMNREGIMEEITDGFAANSNAIRYLKLAIKNKNSEINTLEAVIQNKIHMENILKMKILQIQAKVTREKVELAKSKNSYISIGGNSNLSSFTNVEYTEGKQCQCLIF